MSQIITNLLDRKKGGPCQICSEIHIPQNRCRFEALATKITKLMEANGMIPQILAANKEATTLAQYYQQLLKQADYAMTVVQEVLAENGQEGLFNKILARIDEWQKSKTSNQPTEGPEQIPLFTPESSTQSETPITNFTKKKSGSDSLENSEK